MNPSDHLEQVLRILDRGVSIDWTDVRIYVVVFLSSGLASLLGAYIHSYLSKRGELAAIRKDLDKITKIQEQIRASITKQLWVDQKLWSLKRKTYWSLTTTLSALSSELFDLLAEGFLADKSTVNPDMSVAIPLRQKVETRLEELIGLTAPAKIVLSKTACEIIDSFHERCGHLNAQIVSGVAPYSFFAELRAEIDQAYQSLVEAAKAELNAENREEARREA